MPLLEIENLVVEYARAGGPPVRALRAVSLQVDAGETLGVVGESGCGKSTLAKAIVGLVRPSSGQIRYNGVAVAHRHGAGRAAYCRQVQMVFQDATGSLNPRMTVAAMLDEVRRVHHVAVGEDRHQAAEAMVRLLAQVGLPAETAAAYPRELSGGQCQRVSLARCLALAPRVLVADEPVSALDVSVQARVLNLLRELQQRLKLALVLVSHDLAVVRTVCDRVCVLHEGVVVEQGDVRAIFEQPVHPYTRTLLAAVPDVDRALQARAASACGTQAAPPIF